MHKASTVLKGKQKIAGDAHCKPLFAEVLESGQEEIGLLGKCFIFLSSSGMDKMHYIYRNSNSRPFTSVNTNHFLRDF